MRNLEEILAYKNDYVVEEFLRKNEQLSISVAAAQTLFNDLKRFLWLIAITKKSPKKESKKSPDISITQSMIIIDLMWHEFILVTEHYTDFCEEYFGNYIHHPPPMQKYQENLKILPKKECDAIFSDELIEVVYEYLGEDVAFRWFDAYQKYLV